jgi:ABC-type Zn uptake system ZnuABC Zn-binding protein ZnuA
MVQLIERIKKTRVTAVFLETGANPQLAAQIAKEAGIQVVTELYTHSITEPGGPAPNYIEMIRYNTTAIVNALK